MHGKSIAGRNLQFLGTPHLFQQAKAKLEVVPKS